MREISDLIENICTDCGEVWFTRSQARTTRCPECRRKRINETNRQFMQKKRNPIRKADQRDMMQVLKKLGEYNAKHNTHLSYGKYIALISNQKEW